MVAQANTSKNLDKPNKSRGWVWLLILLLILVGFAGFYLLVLQKSPEKQPLNKSQQAAFLESQPFINERLIIPRLGLNQAIITGDANVLNQGIWYRFPDRGNPQQGGNMVLAGHRYVFGWLPQKVVEQSRFYNLDKLEVGDKVFVNWKDKQYEFKVIEKKTVQPNETSIEARSLDSRLTIYTCTLNGEADGRVVIIAKPKD